MNMLTSQADELRDRAHELVMLSKGLEAPYVVPETKKTMMLAMNTAANRMREAADTILDMRERLQGCAEVVRCVECRWYEPEYECMVDVGATEPMPMIVRCRDCRHLGMHSDAANFDYWCEHPDLRQYSESQDAMTRFFEPPSLDFFCPLGKLRETVTPTDGSAAQWADAPTPTDSDEREMPEHVKVVEPDSWDRLMFDINKQVSESDAKSFIARAKRLVVDDEENDCHD